MLKPLVSFIEKFLNHKILAIFIAYILAVVPLFAILFFFFNQTRIFFNKMPSVSDKLYSVMLTFSNWADKQLSLDDNTTSLWISDNILAVYDVSLNFLQTSLESTTSVIANMILIAVITYFMLLYRTAFKNFVLAQVNADKRPIILLLLNKIQYLTKRYMLGQGLVIIILGLLIGSGLWIIGVPHSYFWGFLAGFLEIIPYVGTSIGGILPLFYMLVIGDTVWQPMAVIALYIFVQQIEGNFISPNIMGQSIRINPLIIILGLFIGGYLWGISGMILVLPVLAITKEICRSFDILIPFSYLMEDGLSRKKNVFLEQFDNDKNRILNLFFEERKGD